MRPKSKLNLLPMLLLILLSVAFFIGMRGKGTDAPNGGEGPSQGSAIAATPVREAEATRVQTTRRPTPEPKGKAGKPGNRDEVAAYIRQYSRLPDYYITKQEATRLGWQGGSLSQVAPGKLIGGDRFGNREGLLPKKAGRVWTECDIDSYGKDSRGAKRIVFSNDGLIYYTDNHYESFVRLEGGK